MRLVLIAMFTIDMSEIEVVDVVQRSLYRLHQLFSIVSR